MTTATTATDRTAPVIGTMTAGQLARAQAATRLILNSPPARRYGRNSRGRRLPPYCGCCGCVTRYCNCSCCCQK